MRAVSRARVGVSSPWRAEDAQRVVAGDAREQFRGGVRRQPAGRGVGREDLHAAVAVLAVRVEHAARDLDELADVADEQRAAEADLPHEVEAVPDEVGGLHGQRGVEGEAHLDEVRAVVAGGEQDVFRAAGPALPELDADRVDEGLLAHGLHDARGAEDGDAAHDAEARVERAARQLDARGDGDDDGEAAPA
jgi:hypothetical protein